MLFKTHTPLLTSGILTLFQLCSHFRKHNTPGCVHHWLDGYLSTLIPTLDLDGKSAHLHQTPLCPLSFNVIHDFNTVAFQLGGSLSSLTPILDLDGKSAHLYQTQPCPLSFNVIHDFNTKQISTLLFVPLNWTAALALTPTLDLDGYLTLTPDPTLSAFF